MGGEYFFYWELVEVIKEVGECDCDYYDKGVLIEVLFLDVKDLNGFVGYVINFIVLLWSESFYKYYYYVISLNVYCLFYFVVFEFIVVKFMCLVGM